MDAYPEATNIVGGRASDERGLMHANQIIERYKAEEAVFKHKAILINVNRSAAEKDSVYAAVRYAWKLDPKKAAKKEIVLAVLQGLIIGAFVADQWLPATLANFPNTPLNGQGGGDLWDGRLLRRLHACIKRGAANPVKYAL